MDCSAHFNDLLDWLGDSRAQRQLSSTLHSFLDILWLQTVQRNALRIKLPKESSIGEYVHLGVIWSLIKLLRRHVIRSARELIMASVKI